VNDLLALRALTHPARQSLLRALAAAGSATATELAGQIGESPANCSWHLRQLARYGFVTEAGGGTGRQRPWRIADPLVAPDNKATVGFAVQTVAWLTPDELTDISIEVNKILHRYGGSRGAGHRRPGSRLVHLVAWGVPAGSV